MLKPNFKKRRRETGLKTAHHRIYVPTLSVRTISSRTVRWLLWLVKRALRPTVHLNTSPPPQFPPVLRLKLPTASWRGKRWKEGFEVTPRVSVNNVWTLCCLFGGIWWVNSIGRTRRRARSKKPVLDGSVPTIFVWDCSNRTRDLSHRTPRTNQLCQSVLQASVACVACVSDRVFAPKFLFHSLLFLTNSLATQAKTRGHNTTYYDLLFQGIDPFSKRRLHSR